MEVAWKCTLQRSGAGSLPASCALAGSQANRTPTIGKMNGRFTNMDLHRGGTLRPSIDCDRQMSKTDDRTSQPLPREVSRDPAELARLLQRCHDWEEHTD